jgi:hypothetical protein
MTAGLPNEQAVAHGIKTTASVVTSAAAVMVGTFVVFALLPVIDMKEMGVGLAAAVLIDATIVRAVLLPATMKLLGNANWYLPSWLQRLPRLEQEHSVAQVDALRRALRMTSVRSTHGGEMSTTSSLHPGLLDQRQRPRSLGPRRDHQTHRDGPRSRTQRSGRNRFGRRDRLGLSRPL